MKKTFSEPAISVKIFDKFIFMSVEVEWNNDWGNEWNSFDS